MYRKTIFVFMVLCLIFSSFATAEVPGTDPGVTGKVVGTIKDKETGEALPGVNVILVGTFQGAASDIDGYYFINNAIA